MKFLRILNLTAIFSCSCGAPIWASAPSGDKEQEIKRILVQEVIRNAQMFLQDLQNRTQAQLQRYCEMERRSQEVVENLERGVEERKTQLLEELQVYRYKRLGSPNSPVDRLQSGILHLQQAFQRTNRSLEMLQQRIVFLRRIQGRLQQIQQDPQFQGNPYLLLLELQRIHQQIREMGRLVLVVKPTTVNR